MLGCTEAFACLNCCGHACQKLLRQKQYLVCVVLEQAATARSPSFAGTPVSFSTSPMVGVMAPTPTSSSSTGNMAAASHAFSLSPAYMGAEQPSPTLMLNTGTPLMGSDNMTQALMVGAAQQVRVACKCLECCIDFGRDLALDTGRLHKSCIVTGVVIYDGIASQLFWQKCGASPRARPWALGMLWTS